MIGKGGNFELVQTIAHQEMLLLSFSLMDRGILHITTYSFTSNTCLRPVVYSSCPVPIVAVPFGGVASHIEKNRSISITRNSL